MIPTTLGILLVTVILRLSMRKKKVIPPPVDVVGRKVSWKPSPNSDRMYGEVVHVGFKWPYPPDPKYPGGRVRLLKKVLSVAIPDGRIFKMSGEHEDLKKIGMIAESSSED
jgi:hypothetical protein